MKAKEIGYLGQKKGSNATLCVVNLSLKFVFMTKTEVDFQANGNFDVREVYCTYNQGCVQLTRGFFLG